MSTDKTFGEERMTHRVSTTFIGWGVAIALSAFACSGSSTENKFPNGDATKAGEPTAGAAGTVGSTTANEKSPMTITGCLQKGDGRRDYILTEVNTTRTKVGTTGSTPEVGSSADVVGKEQMRAAAHAYDLNGDRDTLEPLVGKQVRVSGTLAKSSELNDHDRAGKVDAKDRTKIDEDDLAKVDVTSIVQVADNCGASKGRK
jgi:hypothetical protein